VVVDGRSDVAVEGTVVEEAREDVDDLGVEVDGDALLELLHAAIRSDRHVVVTSDRDTRTGGGYAGNAP
jgi:hypothetical protein